MKLILAIIQPSKVEAVKEALSKVEVFRLTIIDVPTALCLQFRVALRAVTVFAR